MKNIFRLLNRLAPPALAMEGDNIGLLVGDPDETPRGIAVALDATEAAVDLAVEKDCNLIVVHHPLIFYPLKKIDTSTSQGRVISRLLQNGIALFAMHTNLDSAPRGLNDTVARMLELKKTVAVNDHGISYRIGALPSPASPEKFATHVKRSLGLSSVRLYGGSNRIRKVAVCTGSGADHLTNAVARGADALVTGDVRHHHAIECDALKTTLIDAGHLGTERPMIDLVGRYLKKNLTKPKKTIRIEVLKIEEPFRNV